MTALKYDDIIKKISEVSYNFGIFWKIYVVPH